MLRIWIIRIVSKYIKENFRNIDTCRWFIRIIINIEYYYYLWIIHIFFKYFWTLKNVINARLYTRRYLFLIPLILTQFSIRSKIRRKFRILFFFFLKIFASHHFKHINNRSGIQSRKGNVSNDTNILRVMQRDSSGSLSPFRPIAKALPLSSAALLAA